MGSSLKASFSIRFDATDQDSGIYECRANNEFGEVSQKFVLIIYTMPTIYADTDEVIRVRSNSDPVMRCDASGNPAVGFDSYGIV
jgi:Immunoglobulin I-set domain